MTTSVTRPCFTTQHQTCKTKTKTKIAVCKTKTKTNFLVSDWSCLKTIWLTFIIIIIIYFYLFLFSIWRYLVHISDLLMYIHYNSNMGGRHRWLLLFRQPVTNMY